VKGSALERFLAGFIVFCVCLFFGCLVFVVGVKFLTWVWEL
jgi:hypothetical protein